MSSQACKSIHRDLSAYHDGELSSARVAVIASHVQQCADCAAELASFEVVSEALSAAPTGVVPERLWSRIEHELPAGELSMPANPRWPLPRWVSRYPVALLSLAASLLILVGLGIWSSRWHGPSVDGQHAAHAHGDDLAVSGEHMAEFRAVMDDYLQTLPSDAERAERMLLGKYGGQAVAPESAAQLVGYRPIIAGGLPAGYSLASTSVLQMPCCTCFQAVCRRSDGSTLVLFEHDDNELGWFDQGRATMERCGDKDCCLVELDSNIAATWRQGSRTVTAVGIQDQSEVARLVSWLDKS